MEKGSRRYLLAKTIDGNRYRIEKRLFDIFMASLLIICCIPLYLLIASVILICSGRPILFKQKRSGKDNREFIIYKFRSMKQTNQLNRHVYSWQESVPDHFMFKTNVDDTITPIGRVLRKYSLDELPQLFNVVFGEMSIVGPRPEITEITQYYSSRQAKRLEVKPGITGYAQVNGRSEINHGKKIEYDLYYIEHQSFLLDLKIILSTIKQVVKGKGAF